MCNKPKMKVDDKKEQFEDHFQMVKSGKFLFYTFSNFEEVICLNPLPGLNCLE